MSGGNPPLYLYTYINRHAGPPNKTTQKTMRYIIKKVVIIYDNIAIEPYNNRVCFVWCPCMAINASVQYNVRFLPDIILSTQCYHHRGTRLNVMKRFGLCSL